MLPTSSRDILQPDAIMLSAPRQVERPTAGCGEVDDRRPRPAHHRAGHGLARGLQGGADVQVTASHPGDPQDLVVAAGTASDDLDRPGRDTRLQRPVMPRWVFGRVDVGVKVSPGQQAAK